jgi:hypothetical protein
VRSAQVKCKEIKNLRCALSKLKKHILKQIKVRIFCPAHIARTKEFTLESLSTPGGWPAPAAKSASQQGTWIPATDLAAELGTTRRTLARWLLDERLAFPRPHCVNNRLYFERGEVDAWKSATVIKAAEAR